MTVLSATSSTIGFGMSRLHSQDDDFDDIDDVLAEYSSGANELLEARLSQELTTVNASLSNEEDLMLEKFSESMGDFRSLDAEIASCDKALEQIGEVLGGFHESLTQVSEDIRRLQTESMSMSTNLRNRRAGAGLLSNYVNGVIISHELAATICDAEIDENYITHVQELCRKLEGSRAGAAGSESRSQNYLQNHQHSNSAASSEQALEKLKLKAISRVHGFLMSRIQSLRKPKTNLQILQQNVLLKFKHLNSFLSEHAATEVSHEVEQSYTQTMSKVYLQQFRTYLLSLSKLQLECSPTSADLLCRAASNSIASSGGSASSSGAISASIGADALAAYLGVEKYFGNKISEKGNVFALSAARRSALDDVDKDPIVAHLKSDHKFYAEALFRSHQRLLIDTASSEFHFLAEFFLSEGKGKRIFQDVFDRTLAFFREQLGDYIESCWDSVGLLMTIRVVEYYKDKMASGRNLNILDAYFDQLLLDLWPRLKLVLSRNAMSLKDLHIENPAEQPSNATHPHFVTRRFAELTASLTQLQAPLNAKDRPDQVLAESLRELREKFVSQLRSVSGNLLRNMQPRDAPLVFLINNYDLILTIFYERQLDQGTCGHFENLLRSEVSQFIEAQFLHYYPDMIAFVQANETKAQESGQEPRANEATSTSTSSPDAGAVSAPPVDRAHVERITKHFAASWKQNMEELQSFIMSCFVNFNNGMEILKQCLTQLLLYYTRYQKCLQKLNLLKPFQDQIVSNAAILQEIKTFSRGF
ncbi:unnamed protein product [Amoebophrya sp. A25]|nr:unnamed protein product [Amoebophrya sp. A25]|eukprot:GSA25T00012577001.1